MENQSEFKNLAPETKLRAAVEGADQILWDKFEDCLNLGMFIFSSADKGIYINPVLREWLGFPVDSKLDENDFWEGISSLGRDPLLAGEEIKNIKKTLSSQPLLQFPSKIDHEKWIFIQLFSLPSSEKTDSDYGGFIFKGRQQRGHIKDQIGIFDRLLMPSRRLAASVQGNLQALEGNFQNWSPELLEEFLNEARNDLDQMGEFLDLGLMYSKVIKQSSTFRQPVPLIDLLEEIIEEHGYTTLNISESHSISGEPQRANIDLAMVKVALEILFKEIVSRNPASQQVELRVSEKDGFIVLNVDGPRILPLPGLADVGTGSEIIEISPDIYLANEILAAQGGELILERQPAEGGGNLDIEVSLPIAEVSLKKPINQDWGELLKGGSGRILLAEAQPEYQLRIRDALVGLGYRVDLAIDGSAVLDMIQTGQPKLVILARNLPGMDGLLVTQGIRRWSAVPIIMISMRENADDLLYAYRLGVDDYIKKPFLIEELLAKVQVLINRQETARSSSLPEIYQEGSIRIDQGTRQVWVRGNLIQLTPIEYSLLVYLSQHGRQIIPYEQLLEHVWEGPEKGTRQGLFVHVRRLREKIEEDYKNPQILSNKWGVGYEFNP